MALLSDYEANPVALMEALASGAKSLSPTRHGLTELATDGLATAIALDTPPARLAEVLVSVAAAQEPPAFHLPTWDHCVDELLQVYAETVADPR